MKKSNNTSWESVADWYDTLLSGDDTYQTKVILPNLLRLVAPQGKKVIDIACGQGFFSHAFAREGAKEVLGVDLSPDLVSKAKSYATETKQENKPRFLVSPASSLSDVSDNTFDRATIVLALQNIKEMNESLKEAARVLVPHGQLVLVLNHPCFRIPKGSSWGFDEKEHVQYRRVDKYGRPFTVDIDMAPGRSGAEPQSASAKIFTPSFHRPLQDYFKALVAAGFVVIGLEEWISHKKSEEGPRAKAEDDARKEFPMFLTIVARKNV